MHKIDINPVLLARGREWRGGRERAFDQVDVSRVAHLVIDMQAGFVKEGAVAEVPQARTIVDNINAISRAVRSGGGINVFLRFTYDPAEATSWSVWYRTFLHRQLAEKITAAFTAGRPEHELWEQIETAPEDLIINKTRFSAFTPGTCSLDAILKDRGIDTVIVTGTLTKLLLGGDRARCPSTQLQGDFCRGRQCNDNRRGASGYPGQSLRRLQ